jgi:hypothetical protein
VIIILYKIFSLYAIKEVLKVAFNDYAKDNKKSFNQGEDGFWRRNNNKY